MTKVDWMKLTDEEKEVYNAYEDKTGRRPTTDQFSEDRREDILDDHDRAEEDMRRHDRQVQLEQSYLRGME